MRRISQRKTTRLLARLVLVLGLRALALLLILFLAVLIRGLEWRYGRNRQTQSDISKQAT